MEITVNPPKPFQAIVHEWCILTFGEAVANEMQTRCWRFFEEAGELVQSLGMTKEDAHRLVDYTWGRPVGDPAQELGGTMVTLAALATPAGLDMDSAGMTELVRCFFIMDKIRAKQSAKAAAGFGAKTDPLPGQVEEAQPQQPSACAGLAPYDGFSSIRISDSAPLSDGFCISRHSSPVNKFVTLQMAVQVFVGSYLPQTTVLQILKDDDDAWVCHALGIPSPNYRIPKTLCSDPREVP